MLTPVEQIKERLSVADVIGSYVKLEKAGSNLKAKCPFHNEKTPSFFVSPERGSYYCFGCGAKGDIFSFVQAFEGVDFVGAMRTLADRAGIEIVKENPKTRKERDRIFEVLETATAFFEKKLTENSDALEYLKKRGLKMSTIVEWRIGFSPDEWRNCLDHCIGSGFNQTEIEKAGLIKTEKGKTYDRFRSRVMFPIKDSSGRTVAFSGRILGKHTENIPKYINSPETDLFSKSRILYGFDKAKSEIRRKDYAILVEGQMDLIMMHQSGYKNTVASSGTAFTDSQIELLKRLSNRLLMVYDADSAGVNAALKSARSALSKGMEVKVAALPKGTDPAELLLEDAEKFKSCIKDSSNIIDFYLENIMSESKDGITVAKSIREKLLPYVSALESSIEREHFISKISNRTGIKDSAIRDDMSRLVTDIDQSSEAKQSILSPRRNMSERLIAGLVFWQESKKEKSLNTDIIRSEAERIMGESNAREMFSKAYEMADELTYQAESYYEGKDLEQASKELLNTIEEDYLTDELSLAMKKLSDAERVKGGVKDKSELLGRCQEITRKLNDLRSKRHVFTS